MLFIIISPLLAYAATLYDSYDRTRDTRAPPFHDIAGNRKDWGLDMRFGGSLAAGNADLQSATLEGDFFQRFGTRKFYILNDMSFIEFQHVRIKYLGTLIMRVDEQLDSEKNRIFILSTTAFNQYTKLALRQFIGCGFLHTFNIENFKGGLSITPGFEFEHDNIGIYQRTLRTALRSMGAYSWKNYTTSYDMVFLPALNELAKYRFFVSLGLETLLSEKTLGLKILGTYDFNSMPMVPGIKNVDVSISTNIVFHFGH